MTVQATHLGRMAKMRLLGDELIAAAEWSAEAIERRDKGNLAGLPVRLPTTLTYHVLLI